MAVIKRLRVFQHPVYRRDGHERSAYSRPKAIAHDGPDRMAHFRCAGRLSRRGRFHGTAGRSDPRGRSARAGLAPRASAALYRRHLGARRRATRSRPLSGLSHRPRRPVHLPRPGTAGRLRHAGPQAAGRRSAQIRLRPRRVADTDARPVQRDRRAPRGPGRHLDRAGRKRRERLPPSACACAAGSPITGSRSTWGPT